MTAIPWRGHQVLFFDPPRMIGSLDVVSVLIMKAPSKKLTVSTRFADHPFDRQSEIGKQIMQLTKG